MNILYPVVALNRDGTTELLYTKEAVCEFVRIHNVGATWELRSYRFNWMTRNRDYFTKVFNWILRDDRGRKLDPSDFPTTYDSSNCPWTKRWNQREKVKARAIEQGLPVPRTGKRKRRKCRCFEVCSGNKRERSAETVEENMKSNGYSLDNDSGEY